MAFPPPVLPTDKANATPQIIDHPAHHNDMAAAINDTVAEIQALGDGATGDSVVLTDVGAVGNNSADDTVALQAALDAQRTDGRWVEGLNKTYAVAGPIVCPPSAKLRHLKIKAKTGFAPTQASTFDAMVYSSQGIKLTFTADATTDFITTPTAHSLPSDGVNVVFIGTSLPAPLVSGRLYYVRDRTTTTFKVAATLGGAAINLTTAGSGGSLYTEVTSLQKVYLDDVYIDGGNLAALGAIFSLQQQSVCHKLRIDNCVSTGLLLSGQQAVFENFESVNCGTGLRLDSALFMYFTGTDIEGATTGVRVAPASASLFGGGASSCAFFGVHMEQNNNVAAIAVDLAGPHDQLTFENVSVSMNVAGSTVLRQRAGHPANSGYTLRNVRVVAGGAVNRPTMVQDDDRGITLDSWDDFRFRLEEFHAPAMPTSGVYTDPGPLTTVLPAGGYIRSGSTSLSQSKLALKADTGQTGDLATFRDSAGADRSGVNKAGAAFTKTTTAPADADIAASQVFWWLDAAAGAPVVKFKGKDSAGTVFTKSL